MCRWEGDNREASQGTDELLALDLGGGYMNACDHSVSRHFTVLIHFLRVCQTLFFKRVFFFVLASFDFKEEEGKALDGGSTFLFFLKKKTFFPSCPISPPRGR